MKRRTSSSLKIEFSLWVILLISATTATLTGFNVRLEQEALRREVIRRGVALAQYVAAHGQDPFLTGDKLGLATLVADVMNNEDMAYALIVDRSNRVVASDHSELIGKAYLRPPGTYPLDHPAPRIHTWVSPRTGGVIDVGIPLIVQNKAKIGEVHLGLSQSSMDKVLKETWRTAIILAAVFLLAGLAGSVLLVNWMLKPVSELTRGAEAIGAGDLEHQIPAQRENELGRLAATFNRMTRELKSATERALEQERIKKELQVANQIQRMLLPTQTPVVAGFTFGCFYRAAKEVGGDYYDFIPIDKDQLGIVIADVCGKGVPAALLMSMARSFIRSLAPTFSSPAAVARELNRLLLGDLRGGLFITLFYAILNARQKTLTFTSAGHNPLMLWQARTKRLAALKLDPPCLPLGLEGAGMFERLARDEKIDLHNGDAVVLYTDGVTEAMNSSGEEFGEAGLENCLQSCAPKATAPEILQGVEEALTRFCGDATQNDDIAIVTLKMG